MSSDQSQKSSVDLEHHLSTVSRLNRSISPLKDLARYFGKPGVLFLAGGLPSPDYFPFENISSDALAPDSFPVKLGDDPSRLLGYSVPERTIPISIPKHAPGDINLAQALQYSIVTGLPALQTLTFNFVREVYKPAYPEYTTLLHTGNTDGWFKVFQTLCNAGEGVLTTNWTYPSAIAAMLPYRVTAVPIEADDQGMSSDVLRKVLSGWDPSSRRMPRPHVMYVVPAGENPTGTTMTAARKQEIYDICVEYDIIIVEDDPYFFLREGPYIPKDDLSFSDASEDEGDAAFISSLGPTFLRYDYQGRVIRLDTFSKTIAPGCRLGWFTCNPLFSDCLARLSEKASNAPCGISQSLVAKLLLTWKHEGYVRWLHGLSKQYTIRRDAFFDYLFEEFFITRTHCKGDGRDLYSAFAKTSTISGHERDEGCSKVLFSFIPPTSGMFIWIQVHSENRPSLESDKTPEQELWLNLAEADLLLAPGSIFSPDLVGDANQVHFRISFSNSTFDEMKKAVSIFGRVLREYFGVKE